jgi:hypothetical protein
MPTRAVASALAAFLDEWDLREARDLADYLDDFESVSPGDNARTLIAYLRSDDFKSAVRATVAADVMGMAQTSAELQLLGSELRLMEESEARRKPRRSRAARVQLRVHVGLPQAAARRSIKTQTDAFQQLSRQAAKVAVDCSTNTFRFDELKSAAMAAAVREARASMEPILAKAIEAAEAAIRRVSVDRAALEELRAATRASNERRAAEAAAAAADRASVTRRERALQTDLEFEKALRVRAQSQVDQLKAELLEQQGLLQLTMDQLEKARMESES